MKLVLIVPRFPQLSETFIVNKFVGLVDAGWDVHIVTNNPSRFAWNEFPALIERSELNRRIHTQWIHHPWWLALPLWLPLLILTIIRAPWTTIRYWYHTWQQFGPKTVRLFYLDAPVIALSPDIVHFEFGALAIGRTYLKKSLNCFLSASFRGYDINHAGLEDPTFYQPLWETADSLHFLGQNLRQRALRRGCPPEKKYALIPPAIDVDYFHNEPVDRSGENEQTRPFRILSVGRLEWVRGYGFALHAIKYLKEQGLDVEYRIIGNGDYLESLAFTRYEMGLEEVVELMGGQPQQSVLEAMGWADVFLHAAVSEGFGNAVLEAQAMELPVVCTDAGGLPENVADGETGFVVSRRDPRAMAERLRQLAEDPSLRRQIGVAGRARVMTCFQLPDQIKAFDRFYRDMVYHHAH